MINIFLELLQNLLSRQNDGILTWIQITDRLPKCCYHNTFNGLCIQKTLFSLLTHICLVDPSIFINWTSLFPILGVSGILFHFCKQTVQTLIWVCTVCLCPQNGTLGLYGLMCSETQTNQLCLWRPSQAEIYLNSRHNPIRPPVPFRKDLCP